MDKSWVFIVVISVIAIGISFFKDYQVRKRYNDAERENWCLDEELKKR